MHKSVWGKERPKEKQSSRRVSFKCESTSRRNFSVRAVNGSKTSNRKSERFSQDRIIPYFLFNVLFWCLCGGESLKMVSRTCVVSQESVLRGSSEKGLNRTVTWNALIGWSSAVIGWSSAVIGWSSAVIGRYPAVIGWFSANQQPGVPILPLYFRPVVLAHSQ